MNDIIENAILEKIFANRDQIKSWFQKTSLKDNFGMMPLASRGILYVLLGLPSEVSFNELTMLSKKDSRDDTSAYIHELETVLTDNNLFVQQ